MGSSYVLYICHRRTDSHQMECRKHITTLHSNIAILMTCFHYLVVSFRSEDTSIFS